VSVPPGQSEEGYVIRGRSGDPEVAAEIELKPGARLQGEAQVELPLPRQTGFRCDAGGQFDEAGSPLGDVAPESHGIAPFEAMACRVVMDPVDLGLAAQRPARGQFHCHRHDEPALGMPIAHMRGR